MDSTDAERPAVEAGQLFDAEFVDTASGVADDLHVKIPDFDDGVHAEPVEWAPRVNDAGAAVFPSAGDFAAVMQTGDGVWIVVLWKPS